MMKTLRRALMLCLTLGICAAAGTGAAMLAPAAEEEVPAATTVPEEDLEQLSIENGTIAYATATGTGTVRFTPSEDASYTLNDATDIALRFRIMHRQANRPNVSTGLCYVRFKFVGSDTVWGISKEDLQFTFVDAATGEAGTVRVSNGGGNAVGGQINAHSGTDGTLYIPLSQIRDGNQTDDLGNRLTDTENYESLQIEYIEYTYSAHRWNFAFGDVAIVRQSEGEVTTQTLDLEGESQTSNTTLYDVFYDNVTLKVNGTEATETADGNFAVDLGEQGTVYIDSDKLFAYDPIWLHSDLADGYGITSVATSVQGIDGYTLSQRQEEADNWGSGARNRDRSALLTGYTYEGEYYIRKGNHGLYPGGADELETLGAQPVDCTIEVTVSALTPVGITGDGASGVDVYYTRLDTLEKVNTIIGYDEWIDFPDSGEDGKVYLKTEEEGAIVVIPKDGYDFTGLTFNGEAAEAAEQTTGEGCRVTAALYKFTVSEAAQIEILGLGDEVSLGLDIAGEGGSVTVDGTAATGDALTSNIYKTLTIEATPETGYSATVSAVYAAEEEGGEETVVPLTVSDDGKYYYRVDGAFTLKVTFDVVTYNITYRLNSGEYASGESNPATITYFDTVALKDVSREGYDFLGWRIEGSDAYVTELKEISSDITLIAVFELQAVEPDPDDSTDSTDSADPDDSTQSGGGTSDVGGCGSSLGLGIVGIGGAAIALALAKKRSRR